VIEHHQKNLEAMARSWQAVVNSVGAISTTQQEILSATLKDMTEMVQFCQSGGSPQEAMAKETMLTKKTIEAAITNTREIAKLVQKTGGEAFTDLKDRFIAQVGDLLSDPAPGRPC
jgi:phasin family protein